MYSCPVSCAALVNAEQIGVKVQIFYSYECHLLKLKSCIVLYFSTLLLRTSFFIFLSLVLRVELTLTLARISSYFALGALSLGAFDSTTQLND